VARHLQLANRKSFLGKLTMVVFVLFLISGCSPSSEQPEINDDGSIYPSVTAVDSSLTQQCRSEEIRREQDSVIYLNTYFLVDSNGNETVQSQSESSAPCA
jgi:hypothetical protein